MCEILLCNFFLLRCSIFNYVSQCVSVCAHKYWCLLRPETAIPLALELQKAVSCLMWVLGLNSGPLEEKFLNH